MALKENIINLLQNSIQDPDRSGYTLRAIEILGNKQEASQEEPRGLFTEVERITQRILTDASWTVERYEQSTTITKDFGGDNAKNGFLRFTIETGSGTTSIRILLHAPVEDHNGSRPVTIAFTSWLSVFKITENGKPEYITGNAQSMQPFSKPDNNNRGLLNWGSKTVTAQNDIEVSQFLEYIMKHQDNPRKWYLDYLRSKENKTLTAESTPRLLSISERQ